MKLFVDDIRRYPDDWILARTVSEAIRILDTLSVEEISLDHDIACYHLDGSQHSSNETFEPVARFIVRLPKEQQPKIVYIHTANPYGADILYNILKSTDIKIIRDWTFGEGLRNEKSDNQI